MTLVLRLAALGSLVLLVLSAYPGTLVDVFFLVVIFFPLGVPALGIAALILLLSQTRAGSNKPVETGLGLTGDEIVGEEKPVIRRRWRWGILAPAIVVLSLALIWYGIPRRVAFFLCRPAFQRYVAAAPTSTTTRGEPLGRRLGLYFVDRYATDPRGGVYFRTHTGPDGIGPDTMSYGFAYRPNPEGTPFGQAHYGYLRVLGDWYVFGASNDF